MRILSRCWVLRHLWLALPVCRRLHMPHRLLAPLTLSDFEAIIRCEKPLPESFNFAGDVLDQWAQKEKVRSGGFRVHGIPSLSSGLTCPFNAGLSFPREDRASLLPSSFSRPHRSSCPPRWVRLLAHLSRALRLVWSGGSSAGMLRGDSDLEEQIPTASPCSWSGPALPPGLPVLQGAFGALDPRLTDAVTLPSAGESSFSLYVF